MVDFGLESGLVNFILVLFLSISIIEVLDSLIKNDYSKLLKDNPHLQSSIWCWGQDVNTRRCRAINICYHSTHRQWVFLNGPDSVQSGLPNDQFRPALLSVSSVNDHNQFYFNYVTIESQFLKNVSSKLQFRFVKHKTIVFARFKPDNLMHSLHDDILPLKWTLDGLGWDEKANLFMYDDWPHPDNISFNLYFYKKVFNFNEIFIKSMASDNLICFKEIWLGLDRETVWYQYGFHSPQGPALKTDQQKRSIELASKQLRSLFKQQRCSETPYGIFLSRTYNRLILNEDELIKMLNKEAATVIRMNVNDDFVNLIIKISCANLLIGMHGSTLILSLFLPPGSSIVEMFPFGINPEHYTPYKTIAQTLKLNYIRWVNQNLNNSIQHPEYPVSLGGIDDLPDKMKSQIKNLTEDLEPHLCCHDPNWLYRIYQDTFVDVNHFRETVVDILNSNSTLSQPNMQISSNFYPGPVRNIECKYEESKGFQINWDNPWNIEFSGTDQFGKINFELLTDEGNGKGLVSFSSTNFLVLPFKGKEVFSFWVRCNFNDKKGPFTLAHCLK
ncbi:protein O-linked-mannose beta-1,4-N-acetylglucosaminyltransferase 2 [Tetranychus urticae]|uniref:protein O-linked-mannose beta-1,4-N-acetylglucosaminyltransferase 2 n=1 Tax=Tetranychus urticae TaxID=32264 RepID=UPI00077BD095|nr:protein O-linked-mannose beta-1,4-N-acetylglucosaminyltransferase 2 [Tetranychus urticae]